jgi:hypothetical protein
VWAWLQEEDDNERKKERKKDEEATTKKALYTMATGVMKRDTLQIVAITLRSSRDKRRR